MLTSQCLLVAGVMHVFCRCCLCNRLPWRLLSACHRSWKEMCGSSDHSPGAHLQPYRDLIVDVTVLQILEQIVGVVRLVPQERVQQRPPFILHVPVVALWEAFNKKIRPQKSSWTSWYDDGLSRSIPITTNTKIMNSGISIVSLPKLVFSSSIQALHFNYIFFSKNPTCR